VSEEHQPQHVAIKLHVNGSERTVTPERAAYFFEHMGKVYDRSGQDGERFETEFLKEGGWAVWVAEHVGGAAPPPKAAWAKVRTDADAAGRAAAEGHAIAQAIVDGRVPHERVQEDLEKVTGHFRQAATHLEAAIDASNVAWRSYEHFLAKVDHGAAQCVEASATALRCSVQAAEVIAILVAPEAAEAIATGSGAVDEIVNQYVGVETGKIHDFDWKKVGVTALVDVAVNAVTAGAGGKLAEILRKEAGPALKELEQSMLSEVRAYLQHHHEWTPEEAQELTEIYERHVAPHIEEYLKELPKNAVHEVAESAGEAAKEGGSLDEFARHFWIDLWHHGEGKASIVEKVAEAVEKEKER
jgi:hypothetical protein